MKRFVGSIVFFCSLCCLLFLSATVVRALENLVSTTVVISAVQVKGSIGLNPSSQELVTIKNSNSNDIDITDWCVAYATATSTTTPTTTAGCVTPADTVTRLFVPAGGSATFATADYKTAHPTSAIDFSLSSGLANTAGHMYLLDMGKTVIDRVGWGTAQNPEIEAVHVATNTLGFVRGSQDTGNNALDFTVVTADITPPSGGIYETTDMCANIAGLQAVVPDGYSRNANAECLLVPPIPYCLHAEVTELLPDPIGDTGNNSEFVELYNPTTQPIPLKDCRLYVGASYSQQFSLPDIELPPGMYQSFMFAETGLQLSNSNGRAKLTVSDSTTIISEAAAYGSVPEGSSWALIAGSWQVTARPTPDAANELVVPDPGMGGGAVTTDEPCPDGKYRNPDTNRCKTIVDTVADLSACAADQERNPDTNRCRKISLASSSLTPCGPDQERNQVTNRCRKITDDQAALTPCQPGYERNPDTNRCRKAAPTIPVKSGVDTSKQSLSIAGLPLNMGWMAVGALGVGAAGYGAYEWRYEVGKAWQSVRRKFFGGTDSN